MLFFVIQFPHTRLAPDTERKAKSYDVINASRQLSSKEWKPIPWIGSLGTKQRLPLRSFKRAVLPTSRLPTVLSFIQIGHAIICMAALAANCGIADEITQ